MRLQGRLVVATLVLLGAAAPDAGATLRVENHIDPAGDPTVISYRLERSVPPPTDFPPIAFQLTDGDYKSFGVAAGTYTATAVLPQGWEVEAIQCFGGPASDFSIDVPNARVTLTHSATAHHSCAFTNRRIPRNSSSSPVSPGIAPSLPPSELAEVEVPRRPALVGVAAGRRFAEATLRITRESIIKGRLLSSRGKILGSARIQRKPGTHVLRVKLKPERVRRMRSRGMRKVTLTLRVAVTAQTGGATHVFKHRVVVKL
jgi:hypothetical protein